jgi:hypothetical protein
MFQGVGLTGRVVYFTMGLPVIMGIILIGRGVSLPNASEGIKLYFASWHSSKLAGTRIWRDAVSQVFFSTGVVPGLPPPWSLFASSFRFLTAPSSVTSSWMESTDGSTTSASFSSFGPNALVRLLYIVLRMLLVKSECLHFLVQCWLSGWSATGYHRRSHWGSLGWRCSWLRSLLYLPYCFVDPRKSTRCTWCTKINVQEQVDLRFLLRCLVLGMFTSSIVENPTNLFTIGKPAKTQSQLSHRQR